MTRLPQVLCPVCQGSQNIVSFSRGVQYWPCPACHGSGVNCLSQPLYFGKGTNLSTKGGSSDE